MKHAIETTLSLKNPEFLESGLCRQSFFQGLLNHLFLARFVAVHSAVLPACRPKGVVEVSFHSGFRSRVPELASANECNRGFTSVANQ
jgi:hypothetical protein